MNPCNLCPRQCNADRPMAMGWCRTDDRIHVSSLVIHKGEEPPISGEKGIVNLFFPSCNMQCIYCQNYEISKRGTQGTIMPLDEVCAAIIELLPMSEGNLGFVSPSHFVPQMVSIIEELWRHGYHPTIVYNTNGYDLPETIRSLEGFVDVWLPDFKYSDDNLAVELSDALDYSTYSLAALKAMTHQVGTTLQTDDRGIARRGIIVRHLVLPGFVQNSIGVLKIIAEEVSSNLHFSLMSQYYPANHVISPPEPEGEPSRSIGTGGDLPTSIRKSQIANRKSLLRPITHQEYEAVLDAFHSNGFSRGWLQDYESHQSYRPDFTKKDPFDKIK
jgi:putative pyruvate formate lyase activating enzyme